MNRDRVVEFLPLLDKSEEAERFAYPRIEVSTPLGTFTVEFRERTDEKDPWGPDVGQVTCEAITYRGDVYTFRSALRLSKRHYENGVELSAPTEFLRPTSERPYYPKTPTLTLRQNVSALFQPGGAIYETYMSHPMLQRNAEWIARKNAYATAVDNLARAGKLVKQLEQAAEEAFQRI